MPGAVLPPVIPEPFAKNADPSLIQNPIPQTTAAVGRASYDQGFPAITMQPVAAGGEPPFGQDFNGLFFALTSQQYFDQAGQRWPFNADVATAIGGYALGSQVVSTDGVTVWQNLSPGNMTDPDSVGSAGWVGISSYGFFAFTSTGGTVTVSQANAGKFAIVINGALISNLSVVLPVRDARQWLIINNTSGDFNTTVRTPSGTGVIIPQGGFSSPVGVYCDGTNIFPTVPAASLIPASAGPDPSTLAERTNIGGLLATFFSQNSATENPPIGNVFVTNLTDQNQLRKASLAYFESAMSLAAIGGQVTTGQVPSAAVTQYAAAILASAALTGVPTAPTAAPGSSSTQVATTAFANPARSTGNPGFFKTAGGDIIARGTLHIGDIVAPVGGFIALPVGFTSPPVVTVSLLDANNGGATVICTVENVITTAGFNWAAREIVSFAQNCTLQWTAVGF